MRDPRVSVSVEAGVARIALRRADKLNALDGAMIEALAQAAAAIDADEGVRAAVIVGEGKAFCAGGDIAAWSGLPPLGMRAWTRAGHRAFEALARLRAPLVAALTGHAFGGGLELAAAADLRVAEEGIRLGLPETGLGMTPGWSGTRRLARRFGAQAIRRLALTGEIVDAREALRLGLVDAVVPAGEGMAAALALAERIAARGPVATQTVKALLNAVEGEDADWPGEALAGALAATTKDMEEGVAAFREKRTPAFPGR